MTIMKLLCLESSILHLDNLFIILMIQWVWPWNVTITDQCKPMATFKRDTWHHTHTQTKGVTIKNESTCKDTEMFVRGERAIVKPPARRHLNDVSLAGQWWSYIECWLDCFVIFQGIRRTSIVKKTYCLDVASDVGVNLCNVKSCLTRQTMRFSQIREAIFLALIFLSTHAQL